MFITEPEPPKLGYPLKIVPSFIPTPRFEWALGSRTPASGGNVRRGYRYKLISRAVTDEARSPRL
jgi:hypothetical protein